MLLYLILGLLAVLYIWMQHQLTYWSRKGVKGPKPILFFGNVFKAITFQEHQTNAQLRWYKEFNTERYVGFYKFLKPNLMIRDPELVKEVLVKAFPHFHTNDIGLSGDGNGEDLFAKNPFVQVGEEWKKNRSIFANFFSANKIRAVFPSMLQVGKEWEGYVRSFGAKELDAKFICCRYTTETMLRSTFSIDGKSFAENSEFLEIGKSVFNPDLLSAIKVMSLFILPQLQRVIKVKLLADKYERRFVQFVKEQIAARDSGNMKSDDILNTIISVRDKYNLSDFDIAGILFGFFTEAYETSSNGIMLALYELARNPHIQDELARSIAEAIENNGGEVTYEVVQKLEYLDKVINETLRHRSLFSGLQKVCTKSFTVPDDNGKSLTIEKGTSIIIPFTCLNQDPEIFPNPEIFDPERFSPEQKAARHKQAFIPFGDGPRMCIGMQQGLFNLKLGLFQIIRYFEVKFGPSQKPFVLHPMSFFNIPKDGVKLLLKQRSK